MRTPQVTSCRPATFSCVSGPAIWLALGGMLLVGCNVARPNWRSPGSFRQQQARATQYDPFSASDVAPEVIGGRPRDFSKPDPEPVRADSLKRVNLPMWDGYPAAP